MFHFNPWIIVICISRKTWGNDEFTKKKVRKNFDLQTRAYVKTVCALYDKPWSAAHKVLKRLFSASLNEYKAKTTFLGQGKTFQLSLKILTNFFFQIVLVFSMGKIFVQIFFHTLILLLNSHWLLMKSRKNVLLRKRKTI